MNDQVNNPSGSSNRPALITVSQVIQPRPITISNAGPIRSAPVFIRPANMAPRSVVLIRPSLQNLGTQGGTTRIINVTQQQQQKPRITSVKSDANRIIKPNILQAPQMQQFQQQQQVQQPQILHQFQLHPGTDLDDDKSNLNASNAPVATLLRNAPISMRLESIKDNAARPVIRKLLTAGQTTSSGSSQPKPPQSNRKVILERQVRVYARKDRKFNVLRYNAYDRVDLSGSVNSNDSSSSSKGSGAQEVFLQRENNLRQYRATHNLPDVATKGAGSEFGSEAKEEARLRRLGVVRQGYQPENQPWVITVGKGRTAKRYKGVRESTATAANVRYFIFCQTKDGNFDAYPVHEWFKVNPEVNYRYLKDDEAEAEYNRRHKTMNLFNVMMKRKLTDETTEEGIAEAKEATARIKAGLASGSGDGGKIEPKPKSKSAGKKSFLLTELDEWVDLSDDDDDDDEEDSKEEDVEGKGDADLGNEADDEGEKGKKKIAKKKLRQAAIVARKRRGTKKRARRRKNPNNSSEEEDDVNEEAWDESEPDDREGDEVDYITDSSSDEEKLSADEREQIYQETGVDEENGLKGLLLDISDSDEHQDESTRDGVDDRDAESEDDESFNAAAPGGSSGTGVSSSIHRNRNHRGRHRQKDSSRKSKLAGDTSSSSESSASSSDSSSSSSSSDSSSDSDVAPDDPARLARKAQKKAELLAKISDKVSANKAAEAASVSSKKRESDDVPAATSGGNSYQSTSMSGLAAKRPKLVTPADDELTAAVRKYLIRKPITVIELLKKIKMKKLVAKNDDAETLLANSLQQLRPLKQIINGQPVLSLKR